MFCSRCGTQLADTCAFCSNCGAPTKSVQQPTNTNFSVLNTSKQNKIETDTIIVAVLSVISVLVLLMLPMLKLTNKTSRSIKILDNFAYTTVLSKSHEIFCRFAFICIVAALIALIFFKLTKKPALFSLIASGVNLAVFLVYVLYIGISFSTSKYPSLHDYEAKLLFGGFVFLGCALALVVLSYIPFSKERIKAKAPQPVITYAPGYKP